MGSVGEDYALLAANGEQNQLISRENDGTVELRGLPPGRYTARFGGLARLNVAQEVELKAGETRKLNFVADSRRGATLPLELKNKRGEPVRNREIWVRLLQLENSSVGSPEENADGEVPPAGSILLRRGTTDADGRLNLRSVPRGRIRVFVSLAKTQPDSPTPAESAPLDVLVASKDAATVTASLVLPE